MDYEKKYKEALERAKVFKKHLLEIHDKGYAEEMDYIFPELTESEDERIRKEITLFLREGRPYYCPDSAKRQEWANWLEKQGEPTDNIVKRAMTEKQRVLLTETNGVANIDWNTRSLQDVKLLLEQGLDYIKELEKQSEQKSGNKVEPKFIVGDWVMLNENHNSIYQVEEIENYHYVLRHILGGAFGEPFGLESLMRLWTIKDAKDGDVLVLNGEVFIYAHRKQLYSIAVAHCFVDSVGVFHFDGEFGYTEKGNSIHPATASQRNLLFAKMKEAGYEWNDSKKEIRKLHERT